MYHLTLNLLFITNIPPPLISNIKIMNVFPQNNSFFLSLDLSWALLYDSLLVLRQGIASFNHTEAWDPSNKVSCREEQVQNKSNC